MSEAFSEMLKDPAVTVAAIGAASLIGAALARVAYIGLEAFVKKTPARWDDVVWSLGKRVWPKKWRPEK